MENPKPGVTNSINLTSLQSFLRKLGQFLNGEPGPKRRSFSYALFHFLQTNRSSSDRWMKIFSSASGGRTLLTRGISLLLPIFCVFPWIYCFGNFRAAHVNWFSVTSIIKSTLSLPIQRERHICRVWAIAKSGHTAGRRTTIDHLINAIWAAKVTKYTVGSFNLR